MNIACTLLVIVGAILLVGLGLVSLVHDLYGRGPHDAPLIEDDGLSWPPRYRGTAPPADAMGTKRQADVEAFKGGQN